MKITWEQSKRLLNEFEMEGFMAQKGLEPRSGRIEGHRRRITKKSIRGFQTSLK